MTKNQHQDSVGITKKPTIVEIGPSNIDEKTCEVSSATECLPRWNSASVSNLREWLLTGPTNWNDSALTCVKSPGIRVKL